ncbi:cobalt ECF transporter T component CbiQ [Lysinibacillus irui]|uniref:Cobalt ECF transporter T component CbiQ n=1 Tax=Lysinibacillus irui TaxID=2998077 RepID=A0AAJ5UTE7_9BACI|nr:MULTISPECIES: cobalt ECF transporter T component CbiQ [Lysinibacillus]MEA0555884.1 cobalt ECF transporter T component CbiQ [Lysinibacillus irui]MEA0976234.1 cobalt ECF transporter T component CbiQ [Lysinibacillus irui]MEA1042388.1 cobalt ECF transporter T component CbiQ [Lysinibacillus irui]WDV05337.1 cobalt ECF transporter T component CbiQ [Lysinibacillus irui]
MLLIDKYAYLNKLAFVHPLEKMIFSLGLLLVTLIMKDERLSLITFFVMSAFIIIGAKIPLKYYIKLLLLPAFFLLTSLVSILLAITPSTTVLPAHVWSFTWMAWTIFIGKASVLTAQHLFFIVLGSISCLYFLILTTSVQGICFVLRQWRLPSLLVELVELTYHFIFIFLGSMQKIHLAQQARLGYHSPMQWLRSISMLIAALFVEMFQRSRELNNAMQSRGGESVYWQETSSYSKKNWLGMAVIFLVLIVYGGYFS